MKLNSDYSKEEMLMRRYGKKPYKIRPYRSYRKKTNKKWIWIISVISILVAIVVLGFILPSRQIVPWEPILKINMIKSRFISSEQDQAPQVVHSTLAYIKSPEMDYQLHKEPVKVKGIYVSGNRAGSDGIDELIALCNRTEINAMVIDVKNDDGSLTFAMKGPAIEELGIVPASVPIKDIEGLIGKLYANDIYPIARIVTFKDNIIKEKHPEYMLKNKDGSFYESNEPGNQKATWLNPYNKDVWDYVLTVSKGAAAVGFKEIQFDYIRFHEGATADKVDFGLDAAEKSKMQVISEFTKYIVEGLHAEGVYVSADVFGAIITSKLDAEIVGQDYAQMAQYLDYICPMVYPSHYADNSFGVEHPDLDPYGILLGAMKASNDQLQQINSLDHKAIVRPWLQDFTAKWMPVHQTYGPEQLKEQIQGVYDEGLHEWLLWNASNRYTEAGLLAK